MEYRWIGKNVDLNLLANGIQNFLKSNGLKDVSKSSLNGNGYVISGILYVDDLRERVIVKVLGSPDDFSVIFQGFNESTSQNILFSLLASFFGGGVFIVRKMKLRDLLERFERDFWVFVEKAIADSGSFMKNSK